jgi:beta-galactosidase
MPAGLTYGHGGTIDISGIQPQQRKIIKDEKLQQTIAKMSGHHGDQELLLNFYFKSKNGAPLIEKGQVLAKQQFCINEYKYPALTAEANNEWSMVNGQWSMANAYSVSDDFSAKGSESYAG